MYNENVNFSKSSLIKLISQKRSLSFNFFKCDICLLKILTIDIFHRLGVIPYRQIQGYYHLFISIMPSSPYFPASVAILIKICIHSQLEVVVFGDRCKLNFFSAMAFSSSDEFPIDGKDLLKGSSFNGVTGLRASDRKSRMLATRSPTCVASIWNWRCW